MCIRDRPKLSLKTLSPPLSSGILGLRMGLYVPTPKFFYNLWGPRESAVSYTHLRAHETLRYLVCRLLLEKKKVFGAVL